MSSEDSLEMLNTINLGTDELTHELCEEASLRSW